MDMILYMKIKYIPISIEVNNEILIPIGICDGKCDNCTNNTICF